MNYRTLAKGALALSLSLIVGSAMAVNTTTTDVQKYGATFENQANPPENDYDYVVDTPVTTYATSSGNGESSGWFGGEGDESKIIAVTGGQALQLNTDAGVLTNKLESSKASEINAGIAAAGAYIETEAKFVASDTLDAGVVGGTDDTKFAIYAYADESKSPCTTNLVVYHAYYDGNGEIAYINEVFDTLVDCDVYTKIRVEMKQMKNPARRDVNVFSVKVANSAALASEKTLDAYLDEELDEGFWFLTVEDAGGNADNKQLSSITFKGTGEVDNLAVGIINETTTYAIDWSASQNVIASNLTANTQLAAGETNFANNVQLAFYPTAGNVINSVNGVAQTPALDVFTYTVNAADTNLTIIAGAPALDDNWTIEGFNPRGEWTDPTAVAADSKTLFYSNLVVNIDPIGEGRTIVAAWVGAQVTASAAASADLANWKFDYDSQSGSRVTGASFSQNKDGDNFFYWWIPITADAVRAAIANQSDIVKTMVVYTDSASSAEAQTLTVSICPKNIEITNTGDVENGETIDVDDWQEQGLVEPTVITIALVTGATYTDDNGTLTFAAPEGYTVSSIYTNGVNTGSTTTFTTNGLTGTVKIIAAATKTRTAPEHKWYENPGKVYTYKHVYAGTDATVPGFNWAIENGNDYFLDIVGQKENGSMLLDFNALEANAGTENALPMIWKYPSTNNRGGTVSKEHNVALIGTYSGSVVYAVPLSADAADETGEVTNKTAVTFKDTSGTQIPGVSMLRFSADGNYIYAQADGQNYIYKFPASADFTQDVEIQAVAQYDIGYEVRNFAYGVVNDTEVIFAGNDSKTIRLLNLSTGAVSATTATEAIKYDQLNIAGTNLYVGHSHSASGSVVATAPLLTQYAIGSDFSLTQTREWTVQEFLGITGATFANSGTRRMAFAVSDDEKSLVIAFQTADEQDRFLIQHVEPLVITVACVGGVTYTEADGVYTFTPNEGYAISSVFTNGVNANTTTTLDLSAADTDVKVVVAAKKIRTAPAHKWWENPGVVGTTAHGLATGGTYGIWHLNGDGDYIAGTSWATQDNMVKGYDVDALVAGTASPVISNRYDLTSKKYVWGAAVSMALNTVFVGSYTEDPIVAPALAYPLNVAEGTMGVDSFVISNDQGIAINDAEFTADGQYLYAAAYYPTASRQYVYKFRVLNGLKSSGMNLEYVEKYDFGQRIRSIGLGQFSGKDVVYALLNDKTVKYVDTSAAEPVATELISGYTVLGGYYGDVVVSGADTETPHITIFGSGLNAYSIDVYTLTTTGTLASSDPVLALDTAAVAALGLSNSQFGFSGFVTENEETLILSWGTSNLYAIQYVEPTYDVTVTVEGGTISTGIDAVPTGTTLHDVPAGTEIVFTAATGNTLSSVTTNTIAVAGIDTSATTYTYTVGDSDATVAVVFAAPSAQKPAWAEASGDGSANDPYWAWATAHAAGQDLYAEGADYSAQYLLNVDADKTPVLKIDSIGVAAEAGVVQLIVSATDGTDPISLRTINGVLSVAVGDTLAALTPTACNAAVNNEDGRATIILPVNSGNFFRARVDFAAPAAPAPAGE